MSHELTMRANGAAEMAYVGKTPWHGLGQTLEAGATIEQWRAAAGMDWRIESSVVQYLAGNTMRTADDRVVLHRSDSGDALGVVSDNYKPVHPGEVLEFFRDLTGAAGFTLDTAGTLFGGKRLWALASIGAGASIADKRDKVKPYLLLSTACDGSMATEARYTTIRVVCNNTLGFARNGAAVKVKVSHRSVFNADSVKKELGIERAQSAFEATMAEFRAMAETGIKPIDLIKATAEVFVPGFSTLEKADKLKAIDAKNGPIQAVGALALSHTAMGSEFSGTSGTVWGWLNAVTEYVDHEARARGQDNRLNSAWFSQGADRKERAREMAVEMIQANGSTRTVYVPAPPAPIVADESALLADILAGN